MRGNFFTAGHTFLTFLGSCCPGEIWSHNLSIFKMLLAYIGHRDYNMWHICRASQYNICGPYWCQVKIEFSALLKNTKEYFFVWPHLVPRVVRVQYVSFWCRAGWQHKHTHRSAAGKRLISSGSPSREPGYPLPQWNVHLMDTQRDKQRLFVKLTVKTCIMLLNNPPPNSYIILAFFTRT